MNQLKSDESLTDFKTVIQQINDSFSDKKYTDSVNIASIDTPLGLMFACANDKGICMLDFADEINLKLKKFLKVFKAKLIHQENTHLVELKKQLSEYFEGKRKIFNLPLVITGTNFQKSAWQSLTQIPYGVTRSYQQQASSINKPNAVRAIANANSANKICIVLPCHRIIGSDGSLTGYSSGLWRKKWLLEFEKMLI